VTDERTAVPDATPAESEGEVRPRVVLLGSGELSRELAISLRRLGAEVIAIDGYAYAPAHAVADQSLVVTMTDGAELSTVIEGLQPDFVVTTTHAVAVEVLETLGAQTEGDLTEVVPGARGVRLTGDREGLRRLAADQLGLPTAPFWFVGSVGELQAVAAHAGYPLLVMPVAGEGRALVKGPADIESAWRRAVGRPEAPQRVLAETVVEVEFHVTLLAVRSEGPRGPFIEFCSAIGHRRDETQTLESWQPQPMSDAALDAAKSIAARIIKALGGRGVFGVELMVNGDEVYFADVTAYPPDTSWVTLRTQRLSAFELQARVILGLAVDTMMLSPGAARLIRANHSIVAPDVLTHALGVPESDVQVFGQAARSEPDAPRGLGMALATAPDVAAARDRAREVASRLNMRDSRG